MVGNSYFAILMTSFFIDVLYATQSYIRLLYNFIKMKIALAGVAQWIQCWPANQRVAGLIPTQGTCLGCWPGPQ